MEWVEIDHHMIDHRDSDPKMGVKSAREFYYHMWRIFVHPLNDYDSAYLSPDLGLESKDWILEIPCPCVGKRDFLRIIKPIPIYTNSVLIGCRKCQEMRVRVSGLITLDWKLWICKDLVGAIN